MPVILPVTDKVKVRADVGVEVYWWYYGPGCFSRPFVFLGNWV